MARKLKTLYQVCPNEGSGWNTLHTTLEAAVKEAQEELDGNMDDSVLHICEIREVKQVTRKSKR